MTDSTRQRVTLAFTGASGAPYGLRLLQCLLSKLRTARHVSRLVEQLLKMVAIMSLHLFRETTLNLVMVMRLRILNPLQVLWNIKDPM